MRPMELEGYLIVVVVDDFNKIGCRDAEVEHSDRANKVVVHGQSSTIDIAKRSVVDPLG